MKRSTIVLYAVFCGMLGAILIAMLVGRIETPDTEKAFSALNAQLGINPAHVSGVYYEYGEADFQGDDAHYFRFTYRDSGWIDGLIGRLGGKKAKRSIGIAEGNRSWWTETSTKDFECFQITSTGYQWQFLWVDRDRKLVMVSLVDT